VTNTIALRKNTYNIKWDVLQDYFRILRGVIRTRILTLILLLNHLF